MMHYGKILKIVLIVIFVIALFSSPVVFFLQKDEKISASENRKLAAMPNVSTDIDSILSFPGNFEKYYNDQFGLRDFFLKMLGKGRKKFTDITGINVVDNVVGGRIIKGKDGWLFLNHITGAPLSDYQNLEMYSQKELWEAVIGFAARKHWLNGLKIKYLFFAAPNKHTIYSEYLPEYIGKRGEVSAMDQLYEYLALYTTVDFVDLRGVLLRNKNQADIYWKEDKESARLYWKTDSHWNSAGADIAQYEVAGHLEKMFPGDISPVQRPKEDFLYKPGRGDLTRYLYEDEVYDEQVPVIFTGLCSRATHRDFKSSPQKTTCASGKINTLVFHDSFFLALKPFFADYFATTYFLWETLSQQGVQTRIAEYQPALVIEELSERFFPYIPQIRGESYQEFWEDNYPKWDKILPGLDQGGLYAMENIDGNAVPLSGAKHNCNLILHAVNEDPQVYFQNIPFERDKLYMLKVVIESPADTNFQVFYSDLDGAGVFPSAALSETYNLHKGQNTVFIPLFSGTLGDRIRLDPGMHPGKYTIKLLEIRGAEDLSRNGVWQ